MTKKAVIFGVNYPGTSSELKGCITDAQNIRKLLIEDGGFKKRDIVLLDDESKGKYSRPTRDNILWELNHLMKHAKAGDELHVHYSGHGSQSRDYDGDEVDGLDETICPTDYSKNGMITDDELNDIFSRLPKGAKLFVTMDCCHSGSNLDLDKTLSARHVDQKKGDATSASTSARATGSNSSSSSSSSSSYSYDSTVMFSSEGRKHSHKHRKGPNIIMISGCRDNQTSADAYINGEYCGAMTTAFIRQTKTIGYNNLFDTCSREGGRVVFITGMRDWLEQEGYSQKPQMSYDRDVAKPKLRA